MPSGAMWGSAPQRRETRGMLPTGQAPRGDYSTGLGGVGRSVTGTLEVGRKPAWLRGVPCHKVPHRAGRAFRSEPLGTITLVDAGGRVLMVRLSERAALKVRELLEAEGDPSLTTLRVAVEGGGCSGFQ